MFSEHNNNNVIIIVMSWATALSFSFRFGTAPTSKIRSHWCDAREKYHTEEEKNVEWIFQVKKMGSHDSPLSSLYMVRLPSSSYTYILQLILIFCNFTEFTSIQFTLLRYTSPIWWSIMLIILFPISDAARWMNNLHRVSIFKRIFFVIVINRTIVIAH